MRAQAALEDDRVPTESRLQNPRARRLALALALTILVAAGYWAIRYVTHGRYVESTNDAYLKADMVDISSKLPGYVEAVLVSDNQAVAIGAPLVRISTTDSSAALSALEADVAAARASVREAELGLQSQDAEIRMTRAQEEEARARADHARRQAERYAPLARDGAETPERLDEINQIRRSADAALDAAIARTATAVHQRAAREAELGGARARVAAATAQQRRARTDVALSELRSGIAGRVGDRTVRPGQYVHPGQRLMTIVPVSQVYVVANFKETQVRRMRIGQPARIAVDALDGRPLEGRIESFSPGTGSEFALLPPQNATGNFTKIVQRLPVKIRLTSPLPADHIVVPGMSVVASVDTRP